ncbi:MAG: GGDEF domain-containing protein, partial [Oscillospiraceae bacterium]|nr:GGDEF domain-containing protein [Oscillospiraceae bacterium]
DTDAPTPFIPRNFSLHEIVPNLTSLLEKCCPLIFMPLNFLNIPLGYVCFHFHGDTINNYYKMSQMINALNNAIGGFRNIRYQLYLSDQLEDMYRFDALTGLHNRISFNFEYNRMIRRISADEQLTVILADLDRLKYINDTFGHGEGDNAIHTVAKALSASVPDDAICTRFGGDELIAVYAGVLDCNEIKKRIYDYLADYTQKSGKPYEVSASVGVYVTQPDDSRDFEQLMKKSDSLMYIEKSQKKKRRQQ